MAGAEYDWWGGDGDFGIPDDSDRINDILFQENAIEFDMHAQTLFTEAFFDGDAQAYSELVVYMNEEYGIDFEEAFEWADFREWYG